MPGVYGTVTDMKVSRLILLLALVSVFFTGCTLQEDTDPELLLFTRDFDFNQGTHEWTTGFADYPADSSESSAFQLHSSYSEPTESVLTKRSIMLAGNNVNRDLFMYLKKKIDQLEPNKDYTITFNVELASDLNAALPSAGGALYLKAGASNIEPKTVIDAGQYVMNIDKGEQVVAGENMILLGDIFTASNGASYSLITRNNTMANSRYVARTNSNGELWLIIGTDATLEGTIKLYYKHINVVFSAS